MRLDPATTAPPTGSDPLLVTLTSAIAPGEGRPGREPVYEWNPNLGKFGRARSRSSTVLPVYPEIASPNPLTGGAIGFGGVAAGGGGSNDPGNSTRSGSVYGGATGFEGSLALGRSFDGLGSSAGLGFPGPLLANPGVFPAVGPPGTFPRFGGDPSFGNGLVGPSSFPDASSAGPTPEVASPGVAAVPEPPAIVATLTGLALVTLAGALQKLKKTE